MQAIAPVTTDQFLQKDQQPLLKLELFISGAWENICNLATSAKELVGWWSFDEGSGITAGDKSGEENDGTLYPTPVLISACDATADWTGTALSIDTDDKKEGTGSLKDTIAAPVVDTVYPTNYNPTGTWDWSGKKHILSWLKCDRPSAAFTNPRLLIYESGHPFSGISWWDLTFAANEWTLFKLLLSAPDEVSPVFGAADLTDIDYVGLTFTAADDTPFWKKIDYVRIDDRPQWVAGKVDTALEFDGVDDYVDIPLDDSLDIDTSSFTMAAWLKFTAADERVIFGKAATQYFCVDNGKLDFRNTAHITGNTAINNGAWRHGAIVVDKVADTATFYVDGDPDGVRDISGWAALGNTFNRIGSLVGTLFFDGIIDELRIYKRALTASEIKTLFGLKGKNYLESISLSHAGAGMSPNPIAATLSAEINNEDAIFHPKHPTSGYTDYFEAGRKVRMSVGAKYGGTNYYWPRIIGHIDVPNFSGKTFKVSISGLDYTKTLADTLFKKTAVPPDNYWGAVATFDSVATTQYGAELYDPPGGDAAEIGAGEADNVANWAVLTNGSTAITSEDDVGGFSDYEIKFVADPGDSISAVWYDDVCAVVAGTEYNVTFKYARTAGDAWLRVLAFIGATLIGGSGALKPAANDTFYSSSFSFTPEANGNLDLRLSCRIKGGDTAPTTWRVDQISIKSVTSQVIHKYQLPDACNGVHYVELDEGAGFLPVWPGRQIDGDEGWFYNPDTQQLYFAEGKIVDAGTANLKIYYYTEQSPENVVADLMVKAGLYADQAAALAAMEETATGFTIPQVWFDAGKSCLDAIRMLCERCDYRFYFKYNGTPVFKPFPTAKGAGSEDMVFEKEHISEPEYYEDWNEIRNRVVIEGLKQALPEEAEEAMPSELKGTAFNQASIDAYGEHTLSIKNHLFQDQTSLSAMCATLLARYKDPMWYFSFGTPFNPAPLEIWDTIKAEFLLKTAAIPGGGHTTVNIRGLIRDIEIDKHNVTYKCEEVT